MTWEEAKNAGGLRFLFKWAFKLILDLVDIGEWRYEELSCWGELYQVLSMSFPELQEWEYLQARSAALLIIREAQRTFKDLEAEFGWPGIKSLSGLEDQIPDYDRYRVEGKINEANERLDALAASLIKQLERLIELLDKPRQIPESAPRKPKPSLSELTAQAAELLAKSPKEKEKPKGKKRHD